LDRIFYRFPNITEAQIRQERIGEIRVLVRRGANYAKEEEESLRAEIAKTIQDGTKVVIDYVDEIERTASGELRFAVSSVAAEDVAGYELFPPPQMSALGPADA
jgi:hypothetical protein